MGARLMLKKPDHELSKPENWSEATRLVRGGLDRTHHGETAEALYLNSGFVYPDGETAEARFAGEEEGYVYARYGNPTVTMFEERLRLLEGSEACYGVASGMAAVWGALACQLEAGDHIVSSRALFGSCYQVVTNILPRFGITYTLVDGSNPQRWRDAVTDKTKLFFLETPSNPTLEVLDLETVCSVAREKGVTVVVDNIFATPVLQKPLKYGADIVVYSGTKHIDGQGRTLGGAIMSTEEFKEKQLKPFLRHTGPSLSPFNAWTLLKGLETLSLRVKAQCGSALRIADFLEGQAEVSRVIYPFLESHPQHDLCRKQMSAGGTMVTFEVAGGKKAAFDLLRNLQIIDISNNLGDAKSLITHPASTTHRNVGEEVRDAMGITDGMVRLSVGLEDDQDLIADLEQALAP